jgi:uracil-DNA glycosylase family 4
MEEVVTGRRKIGRLNPNREPTLSRGALQAELDRDARLRRICSKGMYPLDAPGISMPGGNFLRHALGQDPDDKSEILTVKVPDETKKTGKRTEKRLVCGQKLSELYRRALREAGFTLPIELRGGRQVNVTFVPGHIWGQSQKQFLESLADPNVEPPDVDGPHPARVMVIGKMPWHDETQYLRNLVGASGEILVEILNELKVQGTPKWYVTNILKFVPPDGSTKIRADWMKDCRPLLDEELRIVRPDYILCLGADASKELLGSKYSVSYMEGRVIEHTYPVGLDYEDTRTHTALVMTVVHPAQVARDETVRRTLVRGLARFNLLQQGVRFDKAESGIDHRATRELEELEQLCLEVEHDPQKKDSVIAVDAEWHGEHPVNQGSYIRTIQFAWRPQHGCGVVLNSPGGVPAFLNADGQTEPAAAIRLLKAFFKGETYQTVDGRTVKFRRKRVVGHFFNADLEWLVEAGLDLRREFAVPLYDLPLPAKYRQGTPLQKFYHKKGFRGSVPAWVRTRYEGGADTGMMSHAIEETAVYKLESLAIRYTTVPRYDVALHDWREQYCKERGLKASALEGYGDCPDEVLLPYGIYDADATLRLYYEFHALLDDDYEHNCCREAFWESMIAAPAVLEIHRNGIVVDRDRVDFLTEAFMEARATQEKLIKRWARWPDFNVRSVQHVKEFLFGTELNGKLTKDGRPIRIRPRAGQPFVVGKGAEKRTIVPKHDARSLEVEPLIDTGKPPRLWTEIVERGKTAEHSPSTNKTVLSILAQENDKWFEQINWVRDYRFLDQVLKTVLRPPVTDEDGAWLYDEASEDNLLYDAGLASVICDDGRVRTHIYQTKETGRWSSARPNLQNFAKARDPDYKRLLGAVKDEKGKLVGGKYKYPLRSILQASPGHVLLDVDYTGAELYGMAIMSGDKAMIDHATRNQLHEDDANFYDIHSNVAVMAFNLKCPPTKTGLKSIGKEHLRIIAKSVIFGIAYGRGAKAIAFAAKEQGVKVTVEEAQRVIDTIFSMYKGLLPLFDECKRRAVRERWLCHCYGRFRRFPQALDSGTEGEFERQAMNFPIQGMIASAMSRAIAYLYDYRRQSGNPELFRILLQIHDAILLEVPYENVRFVAEQVLPWAMRTMVPIYPTDMAGVPNGTGPYYLGAEAEVMLHWGELLGEDAARGFGLDEPEWKTDGMVVHYFKPNPQPAPIQTSAV